MQIHLLHNIKAMEPLLHIIKAMEPLLNTSKATVLLPNTNTPLNQTTHHLHLTLPLLTANKVLPTRNPSLNMAKTAIMSAHPVPVSTGLAKTARKVLELRSLVVPQAVFWHTK